MSQQSDTMKAIFDIQMIGMARSLLGLPVDHAFDRVKTFNQSTITIQSKPNLYLTARQNPFNFFKAGFMSSLMITILKQYYRWPMMILIPKKVSEMTPESVKQNFTYLPKIIAGSAIGLLEGLIICPLEYQKTQRMTNQSVQSLVKKKIFTGLNIVVMKQMVSWSSYLYWDAKCRNYMKTNKNDNLTAKQILLCSISTGVMNIITVAPFDTLKTLVQMRSKDNLSLQQNFQKIIKQSGFKGLYSGSSSKFMQFFLQALMTTPVIDYMERNYGKY